MPISISVASGKGGVGKTSIACNLALSFVSMGSRVVFFDTDFALANAHMYMGIRPGKNAHDAISGVDDIKKALVRYVH